MLALGHVEIQTQRVSQNPLGLRRGTSRSMALEFGSLALELGVKESFY